MKILWMWLCCIAVVIGQAYSSVLRLNRFGLHQYGIQNHWQAVTDVTKTGPLQEIHLGNSILSEEGIKKLFQQDLSKLKLLNLTKATSNPKVIKLLLSQDFIYELDTLILDNMNLQCEDFEVIQTKKSKLTKLSLKNNLISAKGLQHLTRMSMNLTQFNFYANSLIHEESIQAILKIGLNQITHLNLGMTSIQQEHLLKILQNVNKQKLKNLTIRQNVYSANFYQKFTQMSFPVLQTLDLFGLIIDDEGFKFFQSFHLPSLVTLNLHQNQLTSAVSRKIITKSNMPKLKNLDVNLNFLNSSFFKYLAEQNFVLEELKARIINMDRAGLREFSKMNLSQLRSMAYCHAMTTPEIIQEFLTKSDLSQLRELNFQGLRNTGNLFKYLIKANLTSLRDIRTPDLGIIDQADLDGSNVFPNLLIANFRYYQKKQIIQKKFLEKIQVLAPNIEELNLVLYKQGYIILSLIKGHIKFNLTKPLKLAIYSQMGATRVEKSAYLVIKLLITPNQKSKILYLHVIFIVNSIGQHAPKDKSNNGSNSTDSNGSALPNTSLYDFDYSDVQQIYDTKQFVFLRKYQQKNNHTCNFQKLYKLNMLNATNENFQIVSKCKMPILTSANIQFISEEKQISFPNFPYLKMLMPIGLPDKEAFIALLENRKFQYYIHGLKLSQLKITPEDMERIMKALPYFSRIRQLDLYSSFLNKNVTSLSANNFRLNQLSLGAVVFSPHIFLQLCDANFEFMREFKVAKAGVDDSQFTSFIQCLEKKHKLVFPKMKTIDLSSTYIESKSIESIMKLHLPLIDFVNLNQVKDPQIFNSIFKYPSSKRLTNFFSYNNYLSSIDPNLDQKNTGRIQKFVMVSESIRDTDIQALQKFDFDSLIIFALQMNKVNDCQSLMHLRKITSQARVVRFHMGESAGLNSQCLSKIQTSQILPNQIAIQIEIPYGQARKFAEHFLNPGQQINELELRGVHVSDEKIIQITKKANLQKLQLLVLTDNDLSDVSLKNLLGREYPYLQGLSMSGNPRMTADSLSLMNGFVYPDLQAIQFSKTSIGDKGVEYLVRNQFPSLIRISLADTDLTGEGVAMLAKLKAPKLAAIDLSCNGLTVDQLALFQTDKFPSLVYVIAYPTITDQQANRLLIKFNRHKKQQKKTDPKFNQNQDKEAIKLEQIQGIIQIQTDIIRSDFDQLEMRSLND